MNIKIIKVININQYFYNMLGLLKLVHWVAGSLVCWSELRHEPQGLMMFSPGLEVLRKTLIYWWVNLHSEELGVQTALLLPPLL